MLINGAPDSEIALWAWIDDRVRVYSTSSCEQSDIPYCDGLFQ